MPETYTYENNILRYEFLNNDFTNDLYKEFDHKATKLGLNSKKIEKDLDSDIDVKEIELEEWSYRDLGIAGVPTYILENNMIITGSQSSETFVNVFKKINSRKTEWPK